MGKSISITLAILLSSSVFACLNEYYVGVNMEGKHKDFVGMPQFYRTFNTLFSQKFVELNKLESIPFEDYKTRSDVAFHLTHLGRYSEALTILQVLNKKYPDEYNIMANLGTVYELNGMTDSALVVLKKTIFRFPMGHHGTEWVHIKILEAKKELEKNPEWLENNKVVDLGISKSSEMGTEAFEENHHKISSIVYQLKERVPFTTAPNLLIANLCVEAANASAIETSIEEAYILYHLALLYDPSDFYDVSRKLKPIDKKLDELPYDINIKDHLSHYIPPLEEIPEPEYDYESKNQYLKPSEQLKKILQYQDEQAKIGIKKQNYTYLFLTLGLAGVLGCFLIYEKFFNKN